MTLRRAPRRRRGLLRVMVSDWKESNHDER